jgi:hypothetical protein
LEHEDLDLFLSKDEGLASSKVREEFLKECMEAFP